MTERKPDHQSWRGFIEQQIEAATQEGQFENLPGRGKPIPGINKPLDENWWIKEKMEREKLAVL